MPPSARVPSAVLILGMVAAYALHLDTGMAGWGLSARALAEGGYANIGLHMLAHGGLVHLAFNAVALWAIGGALAGRMGSGPLGWLRFLALFILSGLAGAALFLVIQPSGDTPMVGASGAIYGLLGLLIRLRPEDGTLRPLRSRHMRETVLSLIKINLLLIALLMVPALLMGGGGGLAWEAHLGGFLFGALAGPWFLPPDTAPHNERLLPDTPADG